MLYCTQRGGSALAKGIAENEKCPCVILGWEEEDGTGRPAQRDWGERFCPKRMMDCRQVRRRWMNADLEGEEAGSHCCACLWQC